MINKPIVIFQYDDSSNNAQISYCDLEDESPSEGNIELENLFVELLSPIVEKYSGFQIDLRAAEFCGMIFDITIEKATEICQDMWNILKENNWAKTENKDYGWLDINLSIV
jgi:hypothetical protein